MSIQISTIISDANTELQIAGQRVDDTDMLVYVNNAIQYFMETYKLPTAERKTDLLLFNGVHEYSLPSDYSGLIEPERPYDLHSPQFDHQTSREMIHWLYGNKTAIKFDRETPYLVLNYTGGAKTLLSACESLTDSGTWAIAGDGGSLALDSQIYTQSQNSIRFTITGSGGTTTLTLTDFPDIDITDLLTNGHIFLDLHNPNTVTIPSITFRIGSDNANYYEISGVTTRHRGDSIGQGFGKISFDMANKTTVGTPDDDATDYLAIVITNATDGTNDGTYRIDNIFIAESVYFQLPYYSTAVALNGSTYKSVVDNVADNVLMPPNTHSAIKWKTLEYAATLSLKDGALANYFARELKRPEMMLATVYPSKESRVQTTYYKKINKG